MASERRLRLVVILLCAAFAAAGCGKPSPPPLAPVQGRVTIDGKPVPHALVCFYPLFEGFGGEVIAEGISDREGRYSLACPLGQGACVGRHKVTVSDAPTPADTREQSAEAQARLQDHLRGLTNRPIGVIFGSVATTPLEVEVTAGGGGYDLPIAH